ncbi:hypothetical protein BKA70DRAFT_1087568 [Coprinopsis sp. MPI-PUGE-AT-0042]|nr:hypothetical protein BKA70DRAFT_1087568 [Coprinopsis sp. MPI-PUGE-AT-0042]
MSLLSRFWAAFRNPRRYVGRDFDGNKFYESPISAGDRPKRTIVYRREEDMWDYIGGGKRLPAQWAAWMSHTRILPPTLEAKADVQRQMRVKYNASLIEAKDREESEQLRQLQSDGHADLIKLRGPQTRGRVTTEKEGESPSLSNTFEATGKASAGQTDSRTGSGKESANPWAAADAPVETQSWTPQLRKRRE